MRLPAGHKEHKEHILLLCTSNRIEIRQILFELFFICGFYMFIRMGLDAPNTEFQMELKYLWPLLVF